MNEPRHLCAVMQDRGEDAGSLATKTGIDARVIAAAMSGVPLGLQARLRLAEALQTTSRELFRPRSAVEEALAHVEEQGHPRYVTDPKVLRSIEEALR